MKGAHQGTGPEAGQSQPPQSSRWPNEKEILPRLQGSASASAPADRRGLRRIFNPGPVVAAAMMMQN